jgi:uncharacterized membrane protein YhaH (DUF805 family)
MLYYFKNIFQGDLYMNYYLSALKKYAVFNGRARRKEYWMFNLIAAIVCAVLSGIDFYFNLYAIQDIGILSTIYSLFVFLPSLAVSARRLHDTNRSGWWMLIGIIPILGGIVLLVFLCQDSNTSENKFGFSPKYSLESYI